jgi:hypothetical protein
METVSLIQKIRAVRRVIGFEDPTVLRQMLTEIEESLLLMQHTSPEQTRRESRHYDSVMI